MFYTYPFLHFSKINHCAACVYIHILFLEEDRKFEWSLIFLSRERHLQFTLLRELTVYKHSPQETACLCRVITTLPAGQQLWQPFPLTSSSSLSRSMARPQGDITCLFCAVSLQRMRSEGFPVSHWSSRAPSVSRALTLGRTVDGGCLTDRCQPPASVT